MAYPVTESHNTPAPKGYEPFYISHYGRHGSRYLIADRDLEWGVKLMHPAREAGALTPLGESVANRLDSAWTEMRGRGGELSPLGARQHKAIAHRMAQAYPQVFTGGSEEAQVTACSTTVMRCAHSMMAFCEGLKEEFPELQIPKESSRRHMDYLNYWLPEAEKWGKEEFRRQEFLKFEEEMVHSDRLMGLLFSDSTFVRRYVDPKQAAVGMYWIACDAQNMETPVDFSDLFTEEEMRDHWRVRNVDFYIKHSTYPLARGLQSDGAKHLLKNFLDSADVAIRDGRHGATLRFGHDGNLGALVGLMRLPQFTGYTDDFYEVDKVFQNYRVVPMAANLQMVFFHDPKHPERPVLVKVMLNEEEVQLPFASDIFPFYRWEDVRAYILDTIETPAQAFIPMPIEE